MMCKKLWQHRKITGLLLALVVLGGATTLIAFAAVPDSSGQIHGCYSSSIGSLRVIDSADQCKAIETSLNWQQHPVIGNVQNVAFGSIVTPQAFLNIPNLGELQIVCDGSNVNTMFYKNTTSNITEIAAASDHIYFQPGDTYQFDGSASTAIVSTGSGGQQHLAALLMSVGPAPSPSNECNFQAEATISS